MTRKHNFTNEQIEVIAEINRLYEDENADEVNAYDLAIVLTLCLLTHRRVRTMEVQR